MPISLYAGENLRAGLSARLGPLFFGTDQLGAFFRGDRLYGADFYAGVKWQPLGLRKGDKARKGKNRGGRGNEPGCYKW